MRAEGVLRLILNIALFAGMTTEITGDKYLKFVAVEAGELKSFLIKVCGNKGVKD
jgi:Ran-binding protein 3